MTLGEAIFTKAQATPALVALIEQRIYPVAITEEVQGPHVIWQVVSSTFGTTHNEAAGPRIDRVQFACFASTYEEAIAVRDAIIAAFDNVALSTGDKGILEDVRESFEEAAKLHRADVDISF